MCVASSSDRFAHEINAVATRCMSLYALFPRRSKHSQSVWRAELSTSRSVQFVEVHMDNAATAAAAAAAAINSMLAHAAIHLDGHNGDSLIAAFSLRPAAIQVHDQQLPIRTRNAPAHRTSSAHFVFSYFRHTSGLYLQQLLLSFPSTSPTLSSPPLSTKSTLHHCLYCGICS
jgi:hypothetical protein